MSRINTFFSWLESTGDEDREIEEVFSLALDEDDVPAAIEWIESLPSEEQALVKARLNRILLASQEYQLRICAEMLEIQTELLASQKTVSAHASYLHMAALAKHPSYH